jgi:hypothetical protein
MPKVLLGLFGNLMRKVISPIEHGQEYTFNDKPGIQVPPDPPIGLKELA